MPYLDINSPEAAGMESARRMQMVLREMKEIPELPSEAPKDVQSLEKVELPISGGVLTYMTGNEYPYRGFPFHEFVDKIDFIKKLSRGVLSGLFHEVKRVNRLWLITLLPAIWFFKPLVYSAIYSFHRLIVRSRIKPDKYSEPIRELHAAFSYDDYLEDGKTRQLSQWLKDILCMILEFDNAYRFRFQDVIEELDKENLKKNPLNELDKFLTSMQSRELGQDIKDTWYLLRLFCKFYLRFDRRMRNIITDTLYRLDLTKLKLSDDDKYFCAHRKDFQPRFLNGLRETPIEKLTDEQKKDRFVIEKAYIAKGLSEEKVRLIDELNTELAKVKEPYEAERVKLQGELDAIKVSLKDLENTLNAEATKAKETTDRLIERAKDETVTKSLTTLLDEDVKALQVRYNTEAEQKNKVSQEKINILVELGNKLKLQIEETDKKYAVLVEENKTAYPKKVAEAKILCQQ